MNLFKSCQIVTKNHKTFNPKYYILLLSSFILNKCYQLHLAGTTLTIGYSTA